MTDTIRLFVGTDIYQRAAGAERALENSVERNCKGPVEIEWMRQGSPDWDWGGQDIGWCTPFSMFRWYIPRFCEFKGKAIYMDADMVVMRDLQELWDHELGDRCGAYAGRMSSKADVILWDCSKVPQTWDKEDCCGRHSEARRLGAKCLFKSRLPAYWDHRDEVVMEGPERTGILHWTRLATQPYKPYQHKYAYDIPHRKPEVAALFWEYLGMSEEEWKQHPDRIPVETATT